ncbi:MAG: DUF433 domain-containing protein [Anaerolineae bacterium]
MRARSFTLDEQATAADVLRPKKMMCFGDGCIFWRLDSKINARVKKVVGDSVMVSFDRITFNPNIWEVPRFEGCVFLSHSLHLIANGMRTEEILNEYPDLEAEDIQQAYAAWAVDDTTPISLTKAAA